MSDSKKRVLVIGYGGSGSQVAAQLAKDASLSVTVVTPFEYMEVSLCMTKVIATDAEEHEKALFPLLREDGVTYVTDQVTRLEDGTAVTKSGHSLPFDVCVLAVGQEIPVFFPDASQTTKDARKAAIAKVQEQVRNAKSIVVSGGGPVGVEACADIALRHKGKQITLVHSHAEVLSAMSDPFRLAAQRELERMGVKLCLSKRVQSVADHAATLDSGETLDCDLYLPCHPTGGNAGRFLKSGSADEKGYARVNDTFKVDGYEKVFAIGDCSNYDPVKTYPKIDDQISVLVQNVKATATGKALAHHVKGGSFMGKVHGPMIVALGHDVENNYGLGPDLPGTCLPFCCWLCCCFGAPCSTPAGPGVAKMKADFNRSIIPRPGQGIHK